MKKAVTTTAGLIVVALVGFTLSQRVTAQDEQGGDAVLSSSLAPINDWSNLSRAQKEKALKDMVSKAVDAIEQVDAKMSDAMKGYYRVTPRDEGKHYAIDNPNSHTEEAKEALSAVGLLYVTKREAEFDLEWARRMMNYEGIE